MATAKDIIAAAGELSRSFERKTRTDGQEFVALKDGHPDWMQEVCFAAHGEGAMLPDDERYEMIEDAADAIAEASEDDGDQDDFSAARDSMADSVDVYNAPRYRWLASNVNRAAYVDDAVQEMGHSEDGVTGDIALGMYQERGEVFDQVLAALRDRVEGA